MENLLFELPCATMLLLLAVIHVPIAKPMPKKTARTSKPAKSAKQKSVAKKAAPKKMTVMRSAPMPAQKSFRAQQDDFYQEHPNAKALLLTFLVSFGLLVYLYMQLGW